MPQLSSPNSKSLTLAEAAKRLGISQATLRNWRRIGHIECHCNKPLLFSVAAVGELKRKIRTNVRPKLRTRANKSAAAVSDLLALTHIDGADAIATVSAACPKASSRECLLFFCALRLLLAAGEGRSGKNSASGTPPDIHWRRHAVGAVVRRWRSRLGNHWDAALWNRSLPFASLSPEGEIRSATYIYR
ncbi:MAG: helix-turn-helix domain-containing protein [Planctomycetes bacterium]|nr:helix-turn-helix domain-containing protein [Planctomycetota bacterium]